MLQQHWIQDSTPVPWSRLYPKTFHFNFQNINSSGRSSTFLCFEVETWEDGSFLDFQKGVFRNQIYGHAELRFLDWFSDVVLSPDVEYRVTWYISWSPCFDCAEQVARFLELNRNMDLSLSAARLYYENEYDQGLRDLEDAGAQVAMMAPEDFEYCWDNFVYHWGRPFKYWKNVRRNYYSLQQKLENILWD